MKIRCLASFLLLCVISAAAQESPCPNLFRYESDGYQWYGIIRIPSTFASKIQLKLGMSIGTKLPPNQTGRIEAVGSQQEILQLIERGDVITYRVHFPVPYPIPKVTSILINNAQYCQGPPETFSNTVNDITTINLQHSLSTQKETIPIGQSDDNSVVYYGGPSSNNRPQYSYDYTTSRPTVQTQPPVVYQPLYTTRRPVQQPITNIQIQQRTTTTRRPVQEVFTRRPVVQNVAPQRTRNQCGVSKDIPNTLITGGTETEPGEWPWMAALYTNDRKGTLSFICSGSLISSKHIITAAHCMVVSKNSKSTGFVIKLGIHNILNWAEVNQKIVRPEEIYTHPEYNSLQNNDIALIVIPEVEFTEFIKPVCVWLTTDSPNGKIGTVVGWGKDENQNSVSPELKKADATIVSTSVCTTKYPYLEPFTTDKTLCAGNEDGTGPCNGDSGGGLYVKKSGYWYIRGVVSNNIPDPDTNEKCTNTDYVIYTDVYKYLDWLGQYIR